MVADLAQTSSEAAAGLQRQLESLAQASDSLGQALSGAFAKGVVEGKRFDETLRAVGERFATLGLKAGLQPLQQGLSLAITSAFTTLGGGLSQLLGNAGSGALGQVTPFAAGGVLASPAFFPAGSGLGLAGEAGPEAILPLSRGPDGRLGVRAGGAGAAPIVNVTVSTPDAASFRRSEAQLSSAIARAVARGQRGL